MSEKSKNSILRELTPAIREYLFPGLPDYEEPFLEGPSFLHKTGFGSIAMYDMAIDREAAFRPMPEAVTPAQEPVDPDELDPRTEQILAEIRRLQEKYGVSIDELEVMLGYTVKLSRLRITWGGRIFLTDYDDKEVKMTNVAKSLYFLYLRHPEGLRFKEIVEHKDELLHIYGNITGRDEPEEIEKSIDILTDPFSNGLNVNASRIKTAFRNVVSDRIARFYSLSGGAGEENKVPLDRDLVIWDY